MSERKFQIIMKVPLGERRGYLNFKELEGSVAGFFDILGSKSAFSGRLLPENIIEINGTLKTLMRDIPFTATGTLESKTLDMTLTEARHEYHIKGVEITGHEEIL